MPREREPRADREQHEGDGKEGEQGRAGREAREGDAAPHLTQCVACQLRSGGECDQRDSGVCDETERVHFLAPHEAEPRRTNGETDEQVAGEARQPRAPRDFAADVRGEQEKPEGQSRTRFERTVRGHAMKKGHHQAQREEGRDGAHGPAKYPAQRAFDNALERRYLPLAVWRSFTSTPTASTPSSTAPTGSPTCSIGSRRWAWTRSRSPTTATCTGHGSSTPRPGRARSGPSSASRHTSRSATGTSASAPLPKRRARIPISCCSRGAAPATSISSSSRPSDSSRAFTAGRASTGKCSSGTRGA